VLPPTSEAQEDDNPGYKASDVTDRFGQEIFWRKILAADFAE